MTFLLSMTFLFILFSSFIADGFHWVEGCGSAGGDPAGDEAYGGEDRGDSEEDAGVGG
jgi:hypothetical protein